MLDLRRSKFVWFFLILNCDFYWLTIHTQARENSGGQLDSETSSHEVSEYSLPKPYHVNHVDKSSTSNPARQFFYSFGQLLWAISFLLLVPALPSVQAGDGGGGDAQAGRIDHDRVQQGQKIHHLLFVKFYYIL